MSYYNIKLPSVLHHVFNDVKERVIIVGDIHGCYDTFMKLLQEINYDETRDTLILCGDLVMKGPQSVQVIKYCAKNKILSVRGNVDEQTLQNYEKNMTGYEWMKELTQDEIDYMYELPYTITINKINSVVVHAGLVNGVPIEQQDIKQIVRMRNIHEDKPTSDIKLGEPWINFWKGPQFVFFGHDAMRRLQQTGYALGLDTACCYGNELTCCIIDVETNTRTLKSVKFV